MSLLKRGEIMQESKKRNQYAYDKKAYDHLHIQIPKGKKDEYKTHATSMGETLNGFIKRAIDQTIESDNKE